MIERRVIAIVNQKGGCGKTTTAVNLSAALAMRGERIALIDLDPQAHATLGVGISPQEIRNSIYDLLVAETMRFGDVLLDTEIPHLHVVPANLMLSGAQEELLNFADREMRLSHALESLADNFPYVIMDCPPALNILTINALVAATHVLIPIQTHFYSLEGMKELLGTVEVIQSRLNPNLKTLGILPTMVDGRLSAAREMLQAIREYFGRQVFETVVHSSAKLFEAPASGKPIFLYDPRSRGAEEYLALANEISQIFLREHAIQANHPVYI